MFRDVYNMWLPLIHVTCIIQFCVCMCVFFKKKLMSKQLFRNSDWPDRQVARQFSFTWAPTQRNKENRQGQHLHNGDARRLATWVRLTTWMTCSQTVLTPFRFCRHTVKDIATFPEGNSVLLYALSTQSYTWIFLLTITPLQIKLSRSSGTL